MGISFGPGAVSPRALKPVRRTCLAWPRLLPASLSPHSTCPWPRCVSQCNALKQFVTSCALQLYLDCLNNLAACHLSLNDPFKAREACIKVRDLSRLVSCRVFPTRGSFFCWCCVFDWTVSGARGGPQQFARSFARWKVSES